MRISDWSSDVCSSDLGATKLIADHTDGAAIRISGENNVLRNLLVGASAARQSGDIDQFGLLVEAADSAGVGARSCLIEGCTFRDHSGHGVVTSGNVYQTRFQSVTVRRSEEHTSELQSIMRISYAVFCLK